MALILLSSNASSAALSLNGSAGVIPTSANLVISGNVMVTMSAVKRSASCLNAQARQDALSKSSTLQMAPSSHSAAPSAEMSTPMSRTSDSYLHNST